MNWVSTTAGVTYSVGAISTLLGFLPSVCCIGVVAIGGDSAIDTDGSLFLNNGYVYYKCGYTQTSTTAKFCIIYNE